MLKIAHLMVKRHHKTIIHDLNVEIPPASCTLFCGDDTSGVKELLACLAGIQEYQSGQILWEEQPLQKMDVAYASGNGSVFIEQTILAYGKFLAHFILRFL